MRVRELPAPDDRVETGPVRFGGDWTGLFIRGDDCLDLAHGLQRGEPVARIVALLRSADER
jgi:hypothetical protein